MEKVIIHGVLPSTYVRTVCMVCEVKGAGYEVSSRMLGSSEYRNIHPFGKIPAISHDGMVVYETLAIGSYLDKVCPGDLLLPEDLARNVAALKWISLINDYVYKSVILGCVAERFIKPMRGLVADEGHIATSAPDIERVMQVIESALKDEGYLAGGCLTLADLFLAPIMHYFQLTPEGKNYFVGNSGLSGWMASMQKLPGYEKINYNPLNVKP